MDKFYRLATEEERAFYTDQLYPLQDRVFQVVLPLGDALYLTGGTALARYHYHHRLSDDLDFFVQDDQLAILANDLIARVQDQGLLVDVEQVSAWFARFFVVDGSTRLKVDMVRDPHLTGALHQLPSGIWTNSVADMGANKITAFEDRAEIKDIIDLYYICQHHDLSSLFDLADGKRIPVAYEHLLTINQQGVVGMALLTQPLSATALEGFLAQLQAATEAEVKKKEMIARQQIDHLVADLLWDFPPESRFLSPTSLPVLRRRIHRLSLPHRRVIASSLQATSSQQLSTEP